MSWAYQKGGGVIRGCPGAKYSRENSVILFILPVLQFCVDKLWIHCYINRKCA